MLHSFHTAQFLYCHYLCSNLFMLYFFSCCTLLMYCSVPCSTFPRSHVFVLDFSPVALFAYCNFLCCTLFMLHYFQGCNQDPHKHLRSRALQQQLTMPLTIVSRLSILDICGKLATSLLFSCFTFSMLYFFHIALYSCCTFSFCTFCMFHFFVLHFFMLHFFHVANFSCCTS